MKKVNNPFIWEEDFPSVYGHTSIAFLKHSYGFEEAKNGDMAAAQFVSGLSIKEKRIVQFKKKYPDAILVPVLSSNKLPAALAQAIGLKTYQGVYKIQSRGRKELTAMERLLNKPRFTGKLVKGKTYIIVDDIVTQGGTVSALRKHILASGGYVAAVAALAFSTDSNIIVPNALDIKAVEDRFNLACLTNILKRYDIAADIRELTRAQIRYLLRFNSISSLVYSLEKANESNCM